MNKLSSHLRQHQDHSRRTRSQRQPRQPPYNASDEVYPQQHYPRYVIEPQGMSIHAVRSGYSDHFYPHEMDHQYGPVPYPSMLPYSSEDYLQPSYSPAYSRRPPFPQGYDRQPGPYPSVYGSEYY
eukprot:NODE_7500_length_433_cov_10.205882_g7334_i0.p1 GENE.NODE_7500_length_433_cov_10.205882_g7334_i0~~NODE_7500_length_433_cov_10.205882_g7334_i0.p1  ORF type:complete len:125 (-),score=1.16 NODE_7500_length_433_cov_10.205882_g7334_i0:3-377(-)